MKIIRKTKKKYNLDKNDNNKKRIFFNKRNIIILTCVLIIVCGGLYYYYYYIRKNSEEEQITTKITLKGTYDVDETIIKKTSRIYDIIIPDPGVIANPSTSDQEIINSYLYFFSDDITVKGSNISTLSAVFKKFIPTTIPNEIGKKNLLNIFTGIIDKISLPKDDLDNKKINLNTDGSSYLIPLEYGFNEHATSFLIHYVRKNLYHIYYCNSGAGIQYHVQKIKMNKHYTKAIYRFILNQTQYDEFIDIYQKTDYDRFPTDNISYLLIKYLHSLKFGKNFELIKKKHLLNDNNEKNLKYFFPSQNTGNCVFRSIYLLLYVVQCIIYNNDEMYLSEFINLTRKNLSLDADDRLRGNQGVLKRIESIIEKNTVYHFYSYCYDFYFKIIKERSIDFVNVDYINEFNKEKIRLSESKSEVNKLISKNSIFNNSIELQDTKYIQVDLPISSNIKMNESLVRVLQKMNEDIEDFNNKLDKKTKYSKNYNLDDIIINNKSIIIRSNNILNSKEDNIRESLNWISLIINLYKKYPLFFEKENPTDYDSKLINKFFESKRYINHEYYADLQKQICTLKKYIYFIKFFEAEENNVTYTNDFFNKIISILYETDTTIDIYLSNKVSKNVDILDICYLRIKNKNLIESNKNILLYLSTKPDKLKYEIVDDNHFNNTDYTKINNLTSLNIYCYTYFKEIFKSFIITNSNTNSNIVIINIIKNDIDFTLEIKDIIDENKITTFNYVFDKNYIFSYINDNNNFINKTYYQIKYIYKLFFEIDTNNKEIFTNEKIKDHFKDTLIVKYKTINKPSSLILNYDIRDIKKFINSKNEEVYNKYGILNLLFRTPDYTSIYENLTDYIPVLYRTWGHGSRTNNKCLYDIDKNPFIEMCDDKLRLYDILYTADIIDNYNKYINKTKIPEDIKYIIILHLFNTNNNSFRTLKNELGNISYIRNKTLELIVNIHPEIIKVIEEELIFLHEKIENNVVDYKIDELYVDKLLEIDNNKKFQSFFKKNDLTIQAFVYTRTGYINNDIKIYNNGYIEFKKSGLKSIVNDSNHIFTDYFYIYGKTIFNVTEEDYLFHNFISGIIVTNIRKPDTSAIYDYYTKATSNEHTLFYENNKIYYLNHETVLKKNDDNVYINIMNIDNADDKDNILVDMSEDNFKRLFILYGNSNGMFIYKNNSNNSVSIRLFIALSLSTNIVLNLNSIDNVYTQALKKNSTTLLSAIPNKTSCDFKTLDRRLDNNYNLPINISPEDINYCIQYADVHYNYNFYKTLVNYMSLNKHSYINKNINLNTHKGINLYGKFLQKVFDNKTSDSLRDINIIQNLPLNNTLITNQKINQKLEQKVLPDWSPFNFLRLPERFKHFEKNLNDLEKLNKDEKDILEKYYKNLDFSKMEIKDDTDEVNTEEISFNILMGVNSINICYKIDKNLFIANHFSEINNTVNICDKYNINSEVEQYYSKNKEYTYNDEKTIKEGLESVVKNLDTIIEIMFKDKTGKKFTTLDFELVIRDINYPAFIKDEVLTLIAYYVNLRRVYEKSLNMLNALDSTKNNKNIMDNIHENLVNSRSCYVNDDHTDGSKYLINVKSMIIWWEYFFGNLGRKDQFDIINNMIDNEGQIINTHKIYQLIMGAGKSSFIAPLLSIFIIYNYKFPLHVIPDNLITQTLESMNKLTNFGIQTIEISHHSEYDIHAIGPFNTQLRNYVISSSNYKKLILVNTEKDYYQYNIFTDSLKNTYVIMDEVDIISNPFTSTLNKPINKKRGYEHAGYDEEYIKLVFDSIIGLHFTNGLYDKTKIFNLENILDICNKYINDTTKTFNNINEIIVCQPNPSSNSANRLTPEDKKIKLVQNLIDRFNKTQFKTNRLDFGLLEPDWGYLDDSKIDTKISSEERINKIAIPFMSNENPVKTSEFADTLLSIILTMMSHMFNTNILRYQDIYKEHHKLEKIKNENIILFSLEEKNSINLDILTRIKDQIRSNKYINMDDKDTRLFVYGYILDLLKINIESSKYSQNITFSDMIQSNICKNRSGFSGTPYFSCPYDYSLQKSMKLNPVEDKSSDGSIFISIINSHIIFFSGNPNSLGFLDDPYMEDKKNKLVAVIDACAYNLGIKSYEYAVSIRRKIDKDIIYLEDSGKVNQKYILSEKGISKYIDDGKRDQKSCAYFDQKNITGIDIRLNFEDTYGIILIDEKTGLRDFSQAAYRLRSLNKGQNLIIVDTSKKRTKLTKQDLIDQLKDVEKKFQENKKQHQSIDNMIALFRQYVLTEYKTLRVGKIHNRDYKFLENNIFSLKLESFENDPGKWDYTYKKFMIDFVEYLNMWLLADKEKISLKGVEILEILKILQLFKNFLFCVC